MKAAVITAATPVALVLLLGAGFSADVQLAAAPIATGLTGGEVAGTPPQRYRGGPTGCRVPDPTGTGGCVTGATAWLLTQVAGHVHRGR